MNIRFAKIEDYKEISTINKYDLGYDYSLSQTKEALQDLMNHSCNAVFVAEENDEVVGYLHLQRYTTLYTSSLFDIVSLAVSGKHRRKGIARELLKHAEAYAKEQGAKGIRLVSGEERTETHIFYEACGYKINKKQINFKKMFQQ